MKAVLVFVLVIAVVNSEVDWKQEDNFTIDDAVADHLCNDHAKEEVFDDCLSCVKVTAATVETVESTKEEENTGDDDEYDENFSVNYMEKTRKAVEECSQHLENPDEVAVCLQDKDEFFICLENIFVESANKRLAMHYCTEANNKDECKECVFDSLKKGWETTFDNKTVKRDASNSEEESVTNDLEENQATEIANNCYHHFPRAKKMKKCATKRYGERMDCIWYSVISEDDKYVENLIVVRKLCAGHELEGKLEECVACVKESNKIIDEEDDDNEDDDGNSDSNFILNLKPKIKAAAGKCGELFENSEEIMECVNKDDKEFRNCLRAIFATTANKKVAAEYCDGNSKTDECVECVFLGLKHGWEKTYQASKSDPQSDHYSQLEEHQANEIIINCSQHFNKEEQMKQCANKDYGEKMDCFIDNLYSSDEELGEESA